nr:AAA family ATPase [Neisseriaceae bacterium]
MKDSVQLLRKLNESCAKALNEAAGFCLARGHHEILPEHWVIKLIEQDHNDLNLLLRQQQIDQNRLWDELLAGLERLPWRRGQQKPELSEHINKWLAQAWLIASVEYGQTEIRSLHLVQALQKSPSMFSVADVWPLLLWRAGQLQEASQWLDQHSSEAPRSEHPMPAAAATEPAQTAPDAAAATPSSSGLSAGQQTPAQAEALQRFTVNLTARARDGHIDAIFGRDDEISQLEDILSRRRKNNPILVGDPGVGKTALAEGLARRIAQDEVGQHLRNVDIVALDLGLLQAGAGLKGEFEQRLKNVIEGIQNAPTPTILFIDEAHTLIGAGNQAGSGDAANLLKPALARGQLRTIAATTWSEYKQYFETDAALERRFQPVKVAEPDDEKACQMLRGIAVQYANHHGIHIQDEAIVAAVTLSRRYLPDRQLPDKAIDLIDTAAAKVAIGLQEAPLSIIKLRSQQAALTTEIDTLTQDQALGHAVNGSRWAECQRQLAAASAELSAAEAQFAQEKAAATAVLAARQDEAGTADSLQQHNAAFKAQQHYLSVDVDAESIATVISEWTGVPAGRLLDDELKRLMTLDDALKRSVIGQDDALAQLSSHLRTTKAGLGHAQRPLGVFLLTGPSGIGKTQTAKALAAELFGSEQALISINMSEYQEAHTVAQLKGAPPGYVGYGKGGVLTEAVRKRPYAVV